MIGALQQATSGAGAAPVVTLDAFIAPSRGNYQSSNGSYTTPVFTANVSGGTEPYSYLWESVEGGVEILSPTEDKTRVRISGYNEVKVYVIRCTITDDAADTASADASGVIDFETIRGINP